MDADKHNWSRQYITDIMNSGATQSMLIHIMTYIGFLLNDGFRQMIMMAFIARKAWDALLSNNDVLDALVKHFYFKNGKKVNSTFTRIITSDTVADTSTERYLKLEDGNNTHFVFSY